MSSRPRFDFPGGKRFAFTILDDTDDGNTENVPAVYRLLEQLGMRATKTVWPVACPEGSRDFAVSQTLDDPPYREFVRDLAARGFEITWHGATMETSLRDRTLVALDRYRDVFGKYPRIHVNHAGNRENIYWGNDRIDSPVLRAVFGRLSGWSAATFYGHVEGSPYWWGDACREHFDYGRNLTTFDINTGRFNPSMPYSDSRRPLVKWWFSASDADDVDEFNALLAEPNVDRLEREGGFCIVATHFGKRFAPGGTVNPVAASRLTHISQRNGWFPAVGELLDWLRARRAERGNGDSLPATEWRRMQWSWGRDRALRHFRRGMRG